MGSRQQSIVRLQREHAGCTRCVAAGHLSAAAPVFSGHWGQRMLLVGQAPGPVEVESRRPFSGRAGRELMRWMVRAGFHDEADFRDHVYMTSMTSCFPGRLPGGAGDRRPSPAEVRLCSPWLDGVLDILRPRLIIPVGTLALARFLPGRRLDEVVGESFELDGSLLQRGGETASVVLLPLPHPSGQSRWNNDPARAERRERALMCLADLRRGLDE